MEDLRLAQFEIETEIEGERVFNVYIEHKGDVYNVCGLSTVLHSPFIVHDEDGDYTDFDIDFTLELDEVFSGSDSEVSENDKSLFEALKGALYVKIKTL